MEITFDVLLMRFIASMSRWATYVVPFFVLFWILKPKFLMKYKLPALIEKPPRFFQEALNSCVGIGVYLIPFVTMVSLKKNFGYSRMYTDFDQFGVAYFVFTILVFIVFTDTFSFWTHYAQHNVSWLKWTHKTHHKSIQVNPLSSYSFSFTDACINMAALFILLLVVPWHPLAYLVYGTFGIVHSAYLHLGFDFAIEPQMKNSIWKWKYTSTHHYLHHQKFECNYGQFFSFWDRFMGTEDISLKKGEVQRV